MRGRHPAHGSRRRRSVASGTGSSGGSICQIRRERSYDLFQVEGVHVFEDLARRRRPWKAQSSCCLIWLHRTDKLTSSRLYRLDFLSAEILLEDYHAYYYYPPFALAGMNAPFEVDIIISPIIHTQIDQSTLRLVKFLKWLLRWVTRKTINEIPNPLSCMLQRTQPPLSRSNGVYTGHCFLKRWMDRSTTHLGNKLLRHFFLVFIHLNTRLDS